MSLAMTRAEREAFLADVHVGVVSLAREGRAPLTVPIWYRYTPGGAIELITDRGSRKGRLLAVGSRVTLCAQTESPPYKFVSVEARVTALDPVDRERDTRAIAHRYLGPQMGDAYVASLSDDPTTSVLVRLTPERWSTVDYTKKFG